MEITSKVQPDNVAALHRVASNARESRISGILYWLLPDPAGDSLQNPLRIEIYPGAL